YYWDFKNIGNIAAYSTCDFIMDEVEVPKELTQLFLILLLGF
ncbi:cyclic lactone autoinducer peptide AgrD, partial [Staphylococcus aureus]